MAPPRRFVPARDGYWDGYAYEIDPDFSALAAEVAARRHGRAAQGQSG
jgi:1-acyl-sn-glycerol-3-phosphate acyltransferase